MKKYNFTLHIGDRIVVGSDGVKRCYDEFTFHGMAEFNRARSIMKNMCDLNSCDCADIVYLNDDCSIKCAFIYDNGKFEKVG